MEEKAIELYLISGFLGCGKTTLLKNMLSLPQEKKWGVLINEFGDVGIDGKLVRKKGIQIKEVSGGSIYCVCKKGDFMKALLELSKTDISLLVVENSGMADPANIHKLLIEFKDKLHRNMNYRGSICVLDSVSFLKREKVLIAVQNQVKASGLILINKTDLVEKNEIEKIRKRVQELNPKAKCIETRYAKISLSDLEESLTDSGYDADTSNRCGERSHITYSMRVTGITASDKVREIANELADRVVRFKGIVETDKGWERVDVVNAQVHMESYIPDIKEDGIILVIQENNNISSEELQKIWKEKTGNRLTLIRGG